jgi:hypothetical protein
MKNRAVDGILRGVSILATLPELQKFQAENLVDEKENVFNNLSFDAVELKGVGVKSIAETDSQASLDAAALRGKKRNPGKRKQRDKFGDFVGTF